MPQYNSHAACAHHQAHPAPHLHGHIAPVARNEMADDGRARQAGHRRAAVHHAGPLAQPGLLRGARAEDVGDGSRGQPDDGAEGAAEDGEGEGPEEDQ